LYQYGKRTTARKAERDLSLFSDDRAAADRIIELGFYLGSGVLTYKNAGLAEVIKDISLDHIVLETDAPYLHSCAFSG
jgi:TatD DNase family protein